MQQGQVVSLTAKGEQHHLSAVCYGEHRQHSLVGSQTGWETLAFKLGTVEN